MTPQRTIMTQDANPEDVTPTPPTTETNPEPATTSGTVARYNRRDVSFSSSTRDFEGATPKIGGVLGLRSENITKKITYDAFLEKLGIYIMTELKNGENVIEVTKNPDTKIIADFEATYKPKELTNEEK